MVSVVAEEDNAGRRGIVPGRGEAYVPPGHEKKGRFVIDLLTSRAEPEAEFGKP
jgi:hypothetical protein